MTLTLLHCFHVPVQVRNRSAIGRFRQKIKLYSLHGHMRVVVPEATCDNVLSQWLGFAIFVV